MEIFPTLQQALQQTELAGEFRGHATTSTGLRRYRGVPRGPVTDWERRWLTNHPVQGTAAALFKEAAVRLDRLYREHDAWLIVPMHDAFVYEAPLESLQEVARLTERVMREVVQVEFPCLRPRVESTLSDHSCWNKDGHSDSVERWIADPCFSLESLHKQGPGSESP